MAVELNHFEAAGSRRLLFPKPHHTMRETESRRWSDLRERMGSHSSAHDVSADAPAMTIAAMFLCGRTLCCGIRQSFDVASNLIANPH